MVLLSPLPSASRGNQSARDQRDRGLVTAERKNTRLLGHGGAAAGIKAAQPRGGAARKGVERDEHVSDEEE